VHESPHTVPHLELVAALLQLLHLIILGKKRRKVEGWMCCDQMLFLCPNLEILQEGSEIFYQVGRL